MDGVPSQGPPRRRPDRSGVYAYENRELELDPPYAAALAADPAASAFWQLATPSYRKVAVSWVMTAKQQVTRDARAARLVADSAAGRLIRSQRYGIQPRWVERAAQAARTARPAGGGGGVPPREATIGGEPTS